MDINLWFIAQSLWGIVCGAAGGLAEVALVPLEVAGAGGEVEGVGGYSSKGGASLDD